MARFRVIVIVKKEKKKRKKERKIERSSRAFNDDLILRSATLWRSRASIRRSHSLGKFGILAVSSFEKKAWRGACDLTLPRYCFFSFMADTGFGVREREPMKGLRLWKCLSLLREKCYVGISFEVVPMLRRTRYSALISFQVATCSRNISISV